MIGQQHHGAHQGHTTLQNHGRGNMQGPPTATANAPKLHFWGESGIRILRRKSNFSSAIGADHHDISTTRGYNEASLEARGSYTNIMGGNFATLHTILGRRD